MAAILLGLRNGMRRFSLTVGRMPKRQISSETGVISRRSSRMTRTGVFIGCGAASVMWMLSDPIHCASGGADGVGKNLPDPSDVVSKFLGTYSEQINQMGFSGLVGLCAGLAAKRVSQEVAVTIGGIFILLQGLNYAGYITINYGKMEKDVKKQLDQDGDGKLTANDIKAVWSRITDFLAVGLASAGGFSSGFALGFYYGN